MLNKEILITAFRAGQKSQFKEDGLYTTIQFENEGYQMSKLVRSTVEPTAIGIDVVKNGSVRILCRWDIRRVEIEDEMGTRPEYEYREKVVWWALPSPAYLERQGFRQVLTDAGRAYLASAESEILGWAMAAGV